MLLFSPGGGGLKVSRGEVKFVLTYQQWSEMGVPKAPKIPKTCYIYATVMKFGEFIPHLKKIQIYVNNLTRPL